ncbi:hypothetical protein E2I00_013072 [Balaenoptera physalus]|uniref:Uncharacterized protein n=1 Tax=Balaenoptera physalus TaxID=9770 RepID=A0A643C7H0_BALPH|nr:hypothetical protein E2I00_013072 [Balaenoptera physalus]
MDSGRRIPTSELPRRRLGSP